MMLSYPIAWAPVVIVVALLVLLTSYLALLALAIGAILALALVVVLGWAAAAALYEVGRRRLPGWSGHHGEAGSESERDHVYS